MGIFFTKTIKNKIILENNNYQKRQKKNFKKLEQDTDFLTKDENNIKKLVDEAVSNQDYEPDYDELEKLREEKARLEFLNLKDFEKADFLYKSIDFIEQKKNFEKQQKKIEKEQILIKNLENNYRKRIHIFSKLNVYIKNKRKK